jgi:CheY-like chemotaxis protein/HAMP domain-containing protein
VRGVAGTWKDLTDNVNSMAGNLTSQVRGIAKVVTAVANGDLKRKLTVEAKGEIAELADTINSMTETLATFADQVTTVAREVGVQGQLGGQASVPGAAGTWKDLTDNVNQLAANLTTQVRAIADVATAVTKGDLTRSIQVAAQGEVASLKDNINEMIRNLKDTTLKNSEQDWLKTNLAKFSRMLQGQKDLLAVGKLILSELAPVVDARHAVFYTVQPAREDGDASTLKLLAAYAYTGPMDAQLRLGEGLTGQCAVERKKISITTPQGYVTISSGLGEADAHNILVLPVLFEGQVKAVLELASFERFSQTHQVFLDQLMESIGIVFNTIEANMRTEDLLKQSQSLALELQSQQEELKNTNQELQEKAQLLAEQNVEVERKNAEVEQARKALEEKATQLALTSKYKSEFLANMSHELRTPLNSLLILSDQLSRNQEKNLTGKQVEFAETIHDSGKDLLALINDILDLSKIESGTVTIDPEEILFADLHDYVERTFRHVAEQRGLDFSIHVSEGMSRSIYTDAKRLQQVLKNLLSNAFKFTEKGFVEVRIETASSGWSRDSGLGHSNTVFAFSVRDTGIGIAPDKQQIIFEAFQQADGSTSRRYGGTGLGLNISREISRMLGGDLVVDSAPGAGSTFTLFLPKNYTTPTPKAATTNGSAAPDAIAVPVAPVETTEVAPTTRPLPSLPDLVPVLMRDQVLDDRAIIQPGDRTVLIVDNDTSFVRFLIDLARQRGFKVLASTQGTAAVYLAQDYKPSAITLDIRLPDIDGWKVLSHLKNDLHTRHIPVTVITTEDEQIRGFRHGAIEVLHKPVEKAQLDKMFDEMAEFLDRRRRRLLIVEDNDVQRTALVDFLRGREVDTVEASTGAAALEAIKREHFDSMVLDLGLPDVSGVELIQEVQKLPGAARLPVIVHTALEIGVQDEQRLRRLAKSVIVKDVCSLDRLLDEATLHLHVAVDDMSESQRSIVERLHTPDAVLAGRKVLVVDDDIRNIFAMTSLLERYQMKVFSAENGNEAIRALTDGPPVDVVLMDIMMPGMDGHDTLRAIRKLSRFKKLPIIALTARAMKGDREKCIEAGASDYIAKPVDADQLVSLLSMWLHR